MCTNWPLIPIIQVKPVHGKHKSWTMAVCQHVMEIFLESYSFEYFVFFSPVHYSYPSHFFQRKLVKSAGKYKQIYWKFRIFEIVIILQNQEHLHTIFPFRALIFRIGGEKRRMKTNKITLSYPTNIFLSSVQCQAL